MRKNQLRIGYIQKKKKSRQNEKLNDKEWATFKLREGFLVEKVIQEKKVRNYFWGEGRVIFENQVKRPEVNQWSVVNRENE